MPIETLLIYLQNNGVQVVFLSLEKEGDLHTILKENGIEIYSHYIPKSNPLTYYINQVAFLTWFCKVHSISHIFSNLQQANLIAVLAQYLLKSKTYIFRHHFKFLSEKQDMVIERNRNERIGDWIINKLSSIIIVPSSGVFEGMNRRENVPRSKMSIIPYIYDFNQYKKPDQANVSRIQKKYPCQLMVIMVARLIPLKRHALVIKEFKKLMDLGMQLQMIILGEGPENDNLHWLIDELNLNESVHLLGFRRDFIDYMAAADLLIHPSLTEASNSVVKEMALMKKIVAVCENVGDFSDYIEDGVNGFFMPIDEPEDRIAEIIIQVYSNKNAYQLLGTNLHRTVLEKFSVSDKSMQPYLNLLK